MSSIVKCLIVDDLPENLLVLAELLRQDGIEILEARSGVEALELLLIHDVALALLDVQMPDMDGFELAELMRGSARTRHVPIIFVTAGARDQHRVFKGYETGAVDFLYKPIEPQILRNKAGVFFQLDRQRQQLEMFTALLAHDLRNPLTAILTSALLVQRLASERGAQEAAVRIQASGRRMSRLIEDMLDLARARVGGGIAVSRVPAELDALVTPAVREHQVAAPDRDIEMTRTGTLDGEWDPERIAQVASNLIGNALKHGGEGGPVTVHLDGQDRDTVVLSVANDGTIPAERRARLFDPFQSGEPRAGRSAGLGLGLYIVQQIVKAHGGNVEVRQEERRTIFRVHLPRRQGPHVGLR